MLVVRGTGPGMHSYLTRRHQRLMDESEQALLDATEAKSAHASRIAQYVVTDAKIHRIWEARHAELVRPVAAESRRAQQVFQLRDIDVRLVHKRALIEHIRGKKLRGTDRDKVFGAFYGPRDTQDAILAEHRQYVVAYSSFVSTDHLINVMYDPLGARLIRQYEMLYSDYFEFYTEVMLCNDRDWIDAARPMMKDARQQIQRVRHRINTERPDNRHASFDQQALLARSSRHPIAEYMVG